MKNTSEKGKSKRLAKKPDGYLKLHVEDVLAIIIKCTIPYLFVLNATLGTINIVTFQKVKVYVSLAFYQRITKLKNQELMSVNFVEQEDFYIFQ